MMRVYYDYQIFCLQSVGGISRYYIELAGRLSRYSSGIQTKIIAPVHINEYLAASSINTVGLKIFQFPGKHHFLPYVNRKVSSVLLKNQRPDIYHETYYTSYKQKIDAPRLLTVYDMIHERFPDRFIGPDTKIPNQKADAISRADHIVAISQNTKSDLIEILSVPEEKITVIPLASSFEYSLNTNSVPLHAKPYLLYVGVRYGVKNFSAFLQAYSCSEKLMNTFDVICVGGGPFLKEELQTIRQNKLLGKVHHLQADDQKLATLYEYASLFVYPSIYEGFGLPLLEAMRCGCPVVCSNTSSMPEIAGNAAKYFDPYNVEEMKTIIENTAQSESDRKMLRQRGFERERMYSWDTCVEKTADLYRLLL